VVAAAAIAGSRAMTDGVHVRIGLERYAFDVAQVREIEDRGDITPVPGAPPSVVGVRSLRGTVLPVVELATALGVPGLEPGRYIVVAQDGDLVAGLAVHEIVGVEPLPQELEGIVGERGLVGRALVHEELVGVLDARRILLAVADGG
jgi:purine-binding chemotaxis protein CheW